MRRDLKADVFEGASYSLPSDMGSMLIREDCEFRDWNNIVVGLLGEEIFPSCLVAGEIGKHIREIVTVFAGLDGRFFHEAIHQLVHGIGGCGGWRLAGRDRPCKSDETIQRRRFREVGEEHAEVVGE